MNTLSSSVNWMFYIFTRLNALKYIRFYKYLFMLGIYNNNFRSTYRIRTPYTRTSSSSSRSKDLRDLAHPKK